MLHHTTSRGNSCFQCTSPVPQQTHSCTSILRRGNAKSISVEEKRIMHKKSSQKALSCHKTSTPSKYWTVLSKELNMVEKQCILTEHKEGSGGLAAPADSLTHKGVPGIGGYQVSGCLQLNGRKWLALHSSA